jgi:hypothetical protein
LIRWHLKKGERLSAVSLEHCCSAKQRGVLVLLLLLLPAGRVEVIKLVFVRTAGLNRRSEGLRI